MAAAVVLLIGVIALGRAALNHRRRETAVNRALTQMAALQRLEQEAATARSRIDAWQQADDGPRSWNLILRELDLLEKVEARTTEVPMDADGWNLRRTVLTAPSLTPEALMNLVNSAQSSPHPWRLRSSEFTVNEGMPVTLDARLIFETPF